MSEPELVTGWPPRPGCCFQSLCLISDPKLWPKECSEWEVQVLQHMSGYSWVCAWHLHTMRILVMLSLRKLAVCTDHNLITGSSTVKLLQSVVDAAAPSYSMLGFHRILSWLTAGNPVPSCLPPSVNRISLTSDTVVKTPDAYPVSSDRQALPDSFPNSYACVPKHDQVRSDQAAWQGFALHYFRKPCCTPTVAWSWASCTASSLVPRIYSLHGHRRRKLLPQSLLNALSLALHHSLPVSVHGICAYNLAWRWDSNTVGKISAGGQLLNSGAADWTSALVTLELVVIVSGALNSGPDLHSYQQPL